jgi:hypothetical protein
VHRIIAEYGGAADLTGLRRIRGPVQWPAHELRLEASDGAMSFSDLTVGPNVSLVITRGRVDVNGDLRVESRGRVSVGSGWNPPGVLRVSGHVDIVSRTPDLVGLWESHLVLDSAGAQSLEAAGVDLGPVAPNSFFNNSAIGLLQVGDGKVTTQVHIVDHADNRGGGEPEALYLHASSGQVPTSLRIVGGSTLHLNGRPVYAKINGVLTDLRALFPPGVPVIAFDGGWISLK